jgi:nucleotide-binding universal stress UspA family protein
LINIRNILIPAIKSKIILFGTEYTIRLFPNAVYHILSVIPRMRHRSLYTTLYKDSFEKIARDAINNIEFILHKNNCLSIKKNIIYGDVVKTIREYVKKYRIDIITLTSSASLTPPPKLIGSTALKVIASVNIPALIITPRSYDERERLLRGVKNIGIACISRERISEAMEYVYYFSVKYKANIKLIFNERIDGGFAQMVQQRLAKMGLRVDLIFVRSRDVDEFIEEVFREARDVELLVAVRRRVKYRIPLISPILTEYDRFLIGLSPTPVFLV